MEKEMGKDNYSCKVCNAVKKRIKIGMFNAKTNKYSDENNAIWNGKTCPTCNKKRVRLKMQQLRKNRR